MPNYQLYHTDVMLGGQMKYDLVVGRNNGRLEVQGFHITPISKNIYYLDQVDEYLLNNNHQDNIITFYGKILDKFYRPCVNPQDILVQDFQMGCRRSESYKLYGKQFEFFCPVWIENIPDKLVFQVELYNNYQTDDSFWDGRIELDLKSVAENTFHDKFSKYLSNYFEYLKMNKNDISDILSVDLDNHKSIIHGLNIKTGNVVSMDLNNMVDNLLDRERPMMEFNELLTGEFRRLNLISKQLFNFNICFNIEDICPSGFMLNQIKYTDLAVRVTVYSETVDSENQNKRVEAFPKRDFLYNYNYLPKIKGGYDYVYENDTISAVKDDQTPNVLGYLKDNENVDLIGEYKEYFGPVYWSLKDNNDYIFNLYDGFSGYINNVRFTGRYGSAPEILSRVPNNFKNNLYWCNCILFRGEVTGKFDQVIAKFLDNTGDVKINDFVTTFKKGESWSKFLKYNYSSDNELKIIKFINFPESRKSLLTGYSFVETVTTGNDELTFKAYNDKDVDNDNDDKGIIPILPNVYIPRSGLDIHYADGPSIKTTEVEYTKSKTPGRPVHRYSGKLSPTFINPSSTLYTNLIWWKKGDEYKNDPRYNILRDTKYPQKYPSIGYFPYNSTDLIYGIKNNNEEARNSGYNDLNTILTGSCEFTFFEDNKIYRLNPDISTSKIKTIETIVSKEELLEELVKECICEHYGLDLEENEGLINWMYSLYECDMSYDYADPESLVEYKYDLKITLK